MSQIRKASEILEIGRLTEISVKAEELTFVIRVLSSEYFLALALGPGGNFGKGRYLMRIAGPSLTAEL